ncbi:MAG: radical SAM protein [Candidatus Omnitrophica bacterium]|nr:radical SAM protein [Candidatus Omnitrophota bacterium]
MATLIKKMGYRLKVVDCRLKVNIDTLILNSARESDIIGIATYCDSFMFLETTTALIKRQFPEKLIFLGGPLVTSLPKVILENTSVDCAILGEGELTLIELFDAYFQKKQKTFEGIKGMAYKNNGQVHINPPRPQIKNLDYLPILDYTIWPNYESIVKNGQILISSMRGCPQECSFCFKTIPDLHLKSLKRFEEEVSCLKKSTNFNYTWLNDLTFNVFEKRAMDICKILKKYNVQYHCFARVQKVSSDLVSVLKDTGCLGIWFGIESYDKRVLDANRKNIKIEEVDSAIKMAENAGLNIRGLFIVGLYGETEDSLRDMLAFIKQNNFLPLVKYLVPFPGTSLYQYAVETGAIKDTLVFLRMLSRRKVSDYDDPIINLTGIEESILRSYFRQIWNITRERESCSGPS